jgi:PPOX class probable F420-dependent enzyme
MLAPARNYWLCTTRPDGSPHAAPVWGAVADDVLYVYTEVDTVKARNLLADPRVVVHLESGDDVVLVRGTMEAVADPPAMDSVIAAFAAKYVEPNDIQYLPVGPPVEVVLALRPTTASAWQLSEFDTSHRRWSATRA